MSIWLLFLVVTWVVITRILKPRIRAISWRARLGWLGVSAATGALAIVVIPVSGLAPSAHWNITVTATGNRNVNAKSSEVWLNSVTAGGRALDLGEFTQEGTWDFKDGSLFSNQPGKLTWSGDLAGPLEMAFSSHPWCGIAEVTANDQKSVLDLYSEASTQRVLRLPALGSVGAVSATSYRLAQWLVFTAGFLVVGILLATRGTGSLPRPPGPGAAWLYASFCAVVWMVHLVAFWPGALSPDSMHQWSQVLDLSKLNNDHPFTHTLMNWVVTRVWHSPAAVGLAQIFVFSAVVGWGVASLRRAGVPRWAGILVTSIIALSPATSRMAVTLWKDIPSAILLLATTVLLFNIVVSGGRVLQKPRVWIGLGVCTAMLALVRHEGVIVAAGTLALAGVAFRRHWRPVLCSVAVAGVLYLGMTVGVARILNVKKGKVGVEYLMLHHIAAHWAGGTPFTPQEKELIAAIHAPGDNLLYTPYTVRPLLGRHLDRTCLYNRRAEVKRLFWATLVRRPSVNLRHVFEANQFVWRIVFPPGVIYDTSPIYLDQGKLRYIVKNQHGLVEQSFAPDLARSLVVTWGLASSPVFRCLVWQVPLWFYLGLAGVALAAVRMRQAAILLAGAPVVLQAFTAALLPISNNFRYVFGVYVTSMLLIGLMFVARRPADAFESATTCSDPLEN